jgi:hypothetical protein
MFNRVIVSSDDSDFKNFWPIVVKSWNKYFPEVKVCLAFVTDRKENDEIVKRLKKYGEVYLFPVQPNIPTPNQAKMYRHILAGQFGDDVCMIEDIDTIPLQSEFVHRILSQRDFGKMLRVGSEIYNGTLDEGKFPTSNLTGESYLFKELINPDNLNYKSLFDTWCNIRYYDHKESVNNHPDLSGLDGFSDESLMRVLMNRFSPTKDRINEIKRDVDIRDNWIDRSWWNIDKNKLINNEYVICNFLRPFAENIHLCKPIIEYIFDTQNIRLDEILID